MKKLLIIPFLAIVLFSCKKDSDPNIVNIVNDTIFVFDTTIISNTIVIEEQDNAQVDTINYPWNTKQDDDSYISININYMFQSSNSASSTTAKFKLFINPKPDLGTDFSINDGIEYYYSTKVDAYNYTQNGFLNKQHSTYGGGYLEGGPNYTTNASKVYDLEYSLTGVNNKDILIFTVYGYYSIYNAGHTELYRYNYSRQIAMEVQINQQHQ